MPPQPAKLPVRPPPPRMQPSAPKREQSFGSQSSSSSSSFASFSLAPTPRSSSAQPSSLPKDPSSPPRKQRRRRGFDVEAEELTKIFRLSVPPSHPLTQISQPWPLHQGVRDLLQQHDFIDHDVVDVFRRGSSIFFQVADHTAAYDIVHSRYRLKGTGITIFEVLSEREEQQHSALMPRFLEAVAKGQKAQFYRHRLKIDGKWV